MKIEPGKYYKTRDGCKARVHFRVSEPTNVVFPLVGEVLEGSMWAEATWTAEGHHVTGTLKSKWDLVAEWTEPKKLEAWLDENGIVVFLCPRHGYPPPSYTRTPWLDEPGGESK